MSGTPADTVRAAERRIAETVRQQIERIRLDTGLDVDGVSIDTRRTTLAGPDEVRVRLVVGASL